MRKPAKALVRYFTDALEFEERWVDGWLTDEHSASSYGQVLFLSVDGDLWDAWQIIRIAPREAPDGLGG